MKQTLVLQLTIFSWLPGGLRRKYNKGAYIKLVIEIIQSIHLNPIVSTITPPRAGPTMSDIHNDIHSIVHVQCPTLSTPYAWHASSEVAFIAMILALRYKKYCMRMK